ncbi:hypothetical protein K523DRAFT_337525 [Schizophyllum commune Tattone D]|nr:hypothetical protein K523DRAFT_337525 [Schizophyllum commune Tattone D]
MDHPIHRIPPEILSTIFEISISKPWIKHSMGDAALNVAEVCSSWRKAYRWAALTIYNPPHDDALEDVQRLWPTQFPILTHLNLGCVNTGSPLPFDLFRDSPIATLKFGYSSMLYPNLALTTLTPCWNITKLTVECNNLSSDGEFMPIMRFIVRSPTLQTLKVKTPFWRNWAPVARRTLPSLQSLTLYASAFCHYIAAPKLTSVTLFGDGASFQGGHDALVLQYFVGMIQKEGSAANLRSLRLVNFFSVSKAVVKCLDMLTSLTTLVLECWSWAGDEREPFVSWDLLRALTREDGGDVGRLPCLTSLTLLFVPDDEEKDRFVPPVKRILVSRAHRRTHEGKELAALKKFETNLAGNWTLPVVV